MIYTTEYPSPLGAITLACDGEHIIGLWFNGQKYFGGILPKETEQRAHPLFEDAKRWLDIYFSGREPDFLPPFLPFSLASLSLRNGTKFLSFNHHHLLA